MLTKEEQKVLDIEDSRYAHPTYNKRHGKILFSSLSPLKLQGLERLFLDMT